MHAVNCGVKKEFKRLCFDLIAPFYGQWFNISGQHGEPMDDFYGHEMTRGSKITGTIMGSTRPRTQIPALIKLYRAGKIYLDEMVSNKYPIEKVADAIEEMKVKPIQRNVLILDESLL